MIRKVFILYILVVGFYTISCFAQQHRLVLVKSFPDLESEEAGNYLAHPYDIAFYKNTYIVTDATECCLKVFSTDGKLIRTIGSRGGGPGELSDPFLVAVDETTGNIYCVDSGNNRISCFNNKGIFLNIIRTSLPISDIEFIDKYIYTAAYNQETQSLFCMYDTTGRIVKFFGDFFDPKINKLPLSSFVYSSIYLSSYNDSLYAFFEKLPIIQVYDKGGHLIRTINIRIKKIKNIYKENLRNGRGFVEENKIKLKSWIFGACVEDNKLYCYCRWIFDKMLVLDLSGNLIEKIPLVLKNPGEKYRAERFIKKVGNNFIFLDIFYSQIKVYQLR